LLIVPVYGYCGPISSLNFDIPQNITYFKEQLLGFFESNAIVTVFQDYIHFADVFLMILG
jgi:hypothetical protein